MYGLFANEKLGMPVEKIRLEEIRQEIDERRLANEVQSRQGGWRELHRFPGQWVRPMLTIILNIVTK